MKHVGVTTDPKDIATQDQLGGGGVACLALHDVEGDITLDLAAAHAFDVTLSGDAVLELTNASQGAISESALLQVRPNGFALTWPDTVRWPNDVAAALSQDGSNLVSLDTFDNGTNWVPSLRATKYLREFGKYRYIRIVSGSTVDGNLVQIQTIEIASMPAGTNLLTPASPVTASSSYDPVGYGPHLAVDGLGDTRWSSGYGNVVGAWIQVDLGSLLAVAELRMLCDSYSGERAPLSFQVIGSLLPTQTDGVVLGTFGAEQSAWASGMQSFEVVAP